MDMLYAFLSSMTIWVDHLEFNKNDGMTYIFISFYDRN